jgi:hypothetical protein
MSKRTMYRGILTMLMCLGALLLSLLPRAAAAMEETFPTLQVGSHVYTNVTVTTKAKNYVFILHSAGMANIRIADLSDETRAELGYVPEQTKSQKASTWAKDKMADLHINSVKAKELNAFQEKLKEQSAAVFEKASSVDRRLCGAVMGAALLLYLFWCYCNLLICQKAGHEPGMLIWIPFLQFIPLLRAARMSPWLLLTYFLVVPGLITMIVWCFKIARARGKNPLFGLCLLLPVISLFAFLYLAFADSVPTPATKEDRRGSELMTLEAI